MFSTPRANWRRQPWLLLDANDLKIERRQAVDEGRDLSSVETEFAELAAADLTQEVNQSRAERLLETIQTLPLTAGYPYVEPSDLAGIRALRPAPVALETVKFDHDAALGKVYGAWLGRCVGCLMGKPLEGRRSTQIHRYVEAQGDARLTDYISNQVDPQIAKECNVNQNQQGWLRETISCMVEDDDTNYTVVGQVVVDRYGRDFSPADVGAVWLGELPIFHVCTAERVAYRNLVDCVPPPTSASFHNVYREWIGAQIRADFFGYVNPGNPELAAEYAFRDASISHVKNGIYGEMWVAAMLAAAYVCDDVTRVIEAGLAQIPAKCRLAAGVKKVLAQHADGASYDEALESLQARWDETQSYDWCHTISNAEIVTMALLWGEKDLAQTLHCAIWPGFDTDCNGATSGSVLGLMLGADQLPRRLTNSLHDTLVSGVAGYGRVSISEFAEHTLELAMQKRTT